MLVVGVGSLAWGAHEVGRAWTWAGPRFGAKSQVGLDSFLFWLALVPGTLLAVVLAGVGLATAARRVLAPPVILADGDTAGNSSVAKDPGDRR